MKIKCHKIRNIDKSICTCEQKIAYNYAFNWHFSFTRALENYNLTEVQKSEAIQDIINSVIRSIKEQGIDKKYNIDAIIIAFRQGFENYCNNFFIANDYETIGKVFTIPYEII